MASIIKSVETVAPVRVVWSAIRDIGALHTRLVPGFVVDTVLDGDARIVTFANGMVIRDSIITIDDEHRRLSAEGGPHDHYNGAAQAIEQAHGTTLVLWTADFKPDELAGAAAMEDRIGCERARGCRRLTHSLVAAKAGPGLLRFGGKDEFEPVIVRGVSSHDNPVDQARRHQPDRRDHR